MSDVDFLGSDPGDERNSVEFKLTQLDNSNVDTVKELIFEYEWVRDSETQTLIRRIKKVNYPEILPAYAYATSHLNMMIDIPYWLSEVRLEDWEGRFRDPLRLLYRAKNDKVALSIITFLDEWINRNYAAAVDGSQQEYNINMQGNYKVVNRSPIENAE